MRDVEVFSGFFEAVPEAGDKLSFHGHYATGIRLSEHGQSIAAIHCVIFGRVRSRDEVAYHVRIDFLGESANNAEPFEIEGTVPREADVEGEWTFQLSVEITELVFDADFVMRAHADVDGEVTIAHLKFATSTPDLNALTPLFLS